jgi:N-dimethylarginine dimethylaminohydrolase
MKVNCWNEYDRLKTIILGSVYDLDRVPAIYEGKDQEAFIKINEQSYQELLEFQKILEQHDVKVLRPSQPKSYNNLPNMIKQSPLINMRDFHLAYGNLFFLTYGSFGNRRFQHAWIEKIVNDLIDQDNFVLSANEFNFHYDDSFLKNTSQKEHFVKTYTKNYQMNNLYHAASLLKHNNIAIASMVAGSPIGTKWIQKWLSTLNIEYVKVPTVGHIDGVHSILRKDLLLSSIEYTPLKKFFNDIIIVSSKPEYHQWRDDDALASKVKNPTGWLYECQGYFQEFCAEANALSIDPETVCLSFYDKDFYSRLKNKGINAIYVQWKNRHFWGGGLHCITLDIERDHAGM